MKIAFLYFSFALIISPIIYFVKKEVYRDDLILLRKVLWILSFIFFLKHWLEYFSAEYLYQIKNSPEISYFQYVFKNMIVWNDALSWFVAGIIMFVLWITSNKFSIRFLLWKKWKILQSLVYPAFLISAIHIAFSSRFDFFYTFLILLVVSSRTLVYLVWEKSQKTWKTTKYIFVPCWYILMKIYEILILEYLQIQNLKIFQMIGDVLFVEFLSKTLKLFMKKKIQSLDNIYQKFLHQKCLHQMF